MTDYLPFLYLFAVVVALVGLQSEFLQTIAALLVGAFIRIVLYIGFFVGALAVLLWLIKTLWAWV